MKVFVPEVDSLIKLKDSVPLLRKWCNDSGAFSHRIAPEIVSTPAGAVLKIMKYNFVRGNYGKSEIECQVLYWPGRREYTPKKQKGTRIGPRLRVCIALGDFNRI